jgi:RES domain
VKKKGRRPKKVHPRDKTIVLDSFTQQQLRAWEARGDTFQWLSDRIYFELERQRVAQYEDLCASLRAAPSIPLSLTNWARVTDWRWNLSPLSPAGSLSGIGGRFNIGIDLDRAKNQAFAALYVAENVETAFSEYFGGPRTDIKSGLTLSELALRRATSFTTFLLTGQLEHVLDLRAYKSLEAFAGIIKRFDISPQTKAAVRRAGLSPRPIMRSAKQLWTQLLVAPSSWRLEPQAYGIPAPCQIFGRFAHDAGLEGILFPSQLGSGSCLAVFPENFRASGAHIEVLGAIPDGATHTILDKDHFR